MNSDLFKVKAKDFFKSLASAVFVGVLATIYGFTTQGDFSVFSADWVAIGDMAVNAAFIAFIGHISGIFLTDKNDKILGRWG